MSWGRSAGWLLCGLLASGCSTRQVTASREGGAVDLTDAAFFVDGSLRCADPLADTDGDSIPNGEEGCLQGRDSDGDGVPDWQDFDADGDGISDAIEKGEKGRCPGPTPTRWPCDSDGDGLADYLDTDSDDDGLLDKHEDVDGDGLIGCCLARCGQPVGRQRPTGSWNGCILSAEGCGGGQKCVAGLCTPPAAFLCSEGETDPRRAESFGDGKPDSARGTFICRDKSASDPRGRRQVQSRLSSDPFHDASSGDWTVALEVDAKYQLLSVANAPAKTAAAVVDHADGQQAVAGFIVSLPDATGDIQKALDALKVRVLAHPPGGSGSVQERASGTRGKSHDRFDTIRGTILDVTLTQASDPATARNQLIATLLGRPLTDLGNLPPPFVSAQATSLEVRLTTLRRFAFLRDGKYDLVLDAEGYPKEDPTRPDARRIVVMGAVALHAQIEDATRKTGILVDDLSGGTGLADYCGHIVDGCDVGRILPWPQLDMIWVIDESATLAHRQQAAGYGLAFFQRALQSPVDFRMAVTNAIHPGSAGPAGDVRVGKFCSRAATDPQDDGGVDRFLLPSEQALFAACLENPPGYEGSAPHGLDNAAQAVKKHLPRAANAPHRIRPGARIMVVVVTDHAPAELSGVLDSSDMQSCTLDGPKQAAVDALLEPYRDLFKGISDPEASASFHVIGGVCQDGCGAEQAHGYRELAQRLNGQVGDICQPKLDFMLQRMLDDATTAGCSPIILEYVPIAASLAVVLDGVELPRSRQVGFDFRPSTNSLAFPSMALKQGGELVISYKHWGRPQTDCGGW